MVTLDRPAVHGGAGVDPFHNYVRIRKRKSEGLTLQKYRKATLMTNKIILRNEVQRFPCVPEKWWWKQILARTWWKGISTPSSLMELLFRSADSSSFANASLERQKTHWFAWRQLLSSVGDCWPRENRWGLWYSKDIKTPTCSMELWLGTRCR